MTEENKKLKYLAKYRGGEIEVTLKAESKEEALVILRDIEFDRHGNNFLSANIERVTVNFWHLHIGFWEIEDVAVGQVPAEVRKKGIVPNLTTFAAGFLWSFRGSTAFAPERLCHAIAGTYGIDLTWEEANQLLADSLKV